MKHKVRLGVHRLGSELYLSFIGVVLRNRISKNHFFSNVRIANTVIGCSSVSSIVMTDDKERSLRNRFL